ncbi:MAG TPA: hypothetical protein VFG50_07670, partial [Rhodothermales bacterium]|nr:hypothetical protein [Rhodothermales bacterium]
GAPFKLTAGLHHPLYHFDPALDVYAHGFLNVFTASALLNERAIDPQDVPELLQDGDISHFSFDTEELSWQDRSVSLPAIRKARRKALISFGSCSFEEPRDDLRSLGLL